MKQVVVCSIVWMCMAASAQASGGGYRVVSVGVDQPSAALSRTVLAVQDGADPINRFNIVRLRQRGIAHLGDQPVILVAPFGFPAEFWELSVSADYEDAFAPQVALADHDVWLVDSRLADAAPGQCESGAVDCSAMAGWGQRTAIEDAMFAYALARAAHPFKKPVIGGFSGGSSTALAAVDRHPHAFAGLFLWEGTLYSADPTIRARNAGFCSQDIAQLGAGVVFDPSAQGFKTLIQLASAAPNAPSPIPVFPPGTTNLQAVIFALALPDPTNPLNFTADFIRVVGDPFSATLAYSDIDRVLASGALIGNYAAIAFLRDTHCSIGGLETRFTDDLHRFHGRALVYAEGLGFGQMMLDTAALMTNADVTLEVHPEFAESDRYYHDDWRGVALEPLLDWLQQF